MTKVKVFGIGMHKTGTTSIAAALEILGYKVCKGGMEMRAHLGQKTYFNYLYEYKYDPFFKYLEAYDCCVDNPWYLMFKEIDHYFENSKFILTIRDEQSWLESCRKYFGSKEKRIHKWIYGVSSFPGNEEVYLRKYRKHNQEVRAYFSKRPNDLLELDLEKMNGWSELCSFLKIDEIHLPFPHYNKGQV